MSGHECPAPGCETKKLPERLLACAKHWYQLPADLRAEIWRTYRGHDTVRHRLAVAEAVKIWTEKAWEEQRD